MRSIVPFGPMGLAFYSPVARGAAIAVAKGTVQLLMLSLKWRVSKTSRGLRHFNKFAERRISSDRLYNGMCSDCIINRCLIRLLSGHYDSLRDAE